MTTTFKSSTAHPITVAITDDTQETFRPLTDIEREVIVAALDHFGSRNGAATALGIGRSTLYRKLALYGIPSGPVPVHLRKLGSQTTTDAV